MDFLAIALLRYFYEGNHERMKERTQRENVKPTPYE